jgi:mitochondrial fission protein ELM1
MDNCVGDNNQLFALAEALGYPFDAKTITYNSLRFAPFLRRNLRIVTGESRALLKGPWPDLVIGVGYGSVPVARYIRQQSRGRAKLVHIGNPRGEIEDFDLHITTPQYARGPAANLLELPFPIGNPAKRAEATFEERKWLRAFPRPRRLVAVGGPARNWRLDEAALVDAVRVINGKEPAGSLIVVTSHRTPDEVRQRLGQLVAGPSKTVIERFPSFGTLLSECDEIYVTADSVSMVSEAILSSKSVGLVPIKRSFRGLLALWLWERPMKQATLPNFTKFWKMLHNKRLAGTVELPVASQVCDTVERAADAVRSLLAPGDAVDEART